MRCLLPLLVLLLPSFGQAQLTRAIDIRTLPLERAVAGEKVSVRGTVSFVDAAATVFIQDETGGTFFRTKKGPGTLRAGDLVAVEGVTVSGLYLTGIEASQWTILGHGEPPTPQPASYEDLATGRFHYQRVVVEGIGRRLSAPEENKTLLHVVMGGRVIEVRVDEPEGDLPVIDARLRITALAAGGINDRRQLVFPYLRVAEWSDIQIIEAAPTTESLPLTPAARLLRFGQPDVAFHRVRVSGVVLASFADGRVFIRDDAPVDRNMATAADRDPKMTQTPTALAIRLVKPAMLRTGQRVDVAGFPSMEGFSASLADATVLPDTTPGDLKTQAKPLSLKPSELLSGAHDADLVTLPAVLSEVFRTADGVELHLKADQTPLNAFLPHVEGQPELTFLPGSRLQATGICLIETSSDKGFRSRPERVRLLLRDGADLVILESPSWWTSRRLITAITLLLGALLLAALWIVGLRVQVSRQALALRARIGHEAALEERQRIAREFHDTLEQELAGLSLRLDAATTRPLEEKARGLLETSRHLVSRIQSEARNLVADLRSDPNASVDLGTALQELIERWALDSPALKLEIPRPLPPQPAHLVHHLRMVATEAVTNAVKHAQAQTITIHVTQDQEGRIHLTIQDDGSGIQLTETQGKPGHFGCMGIRERCRKIGAEVSWDSTGKGTTVKVLYPERPTAQRTLSDAASSI